MAEKEHIYITVVAPEDKSVFYKRYAQSLSKIILSKISPDELYLVINKLNEINTQTKKESDTV